MPPRTPTPQPIGSTPGLVPLTGSFELADVVAQDTLSPVVLPVLARVSLDRFHFSGLTKGVVNQLGAKVAGCPTGKVVMPGGGMFVAGVSPVSAVAVVAPPVITFSRTAKGHSRSGGAGTSGATWQLSIGGHRLAVTIRPASSRQEGSPVRRATSRWTPGRSRADR